MKLGAFLLCTAWSLLACNMWLQPLVEVESTHYGVDDGHNDEDDGCNGEESKRSASGEISLLFCGRVHAD